MCSCLAKDPHQRMTSLDAQRNGKPSPQHPTAGADLLYACLLHRFTSSWVYHLASEDPMLCAGFFKQALQATRDKSPVRVHLHSSSVVENAQMLLYHTQQAVGSGAGARCQKATRWNVCRGSCQQQLAEPYSDSGGPEGRPTQPSQTSSL